MAITAAHNPTAPVAASSPPDVAADNVLGAKLIHPRAEVARALGIALEKGLQIKAVRIRYQEDLDEARTAKLSWTRATNDLLGALFDNASVADYCNDWGGKIFPEYAEFGNFVEQFYEEMEHRVGKLRSVLRCVEQVTDVRAAAPAGTLPAVDTPAVDAPAIAPNGDDPAPVGVVTHSAAPRRTPNVVLLGAAADDSPRNAAVEFLTRLGIASKRGEDVAMCDQMHGAAVFLLPTQPADPAAQRVILFQLGCAVGRLGVNRVCVLHPPAVTPIAEGGVTHVAVDLAGAWHIPFARYLKLAGLDVDLNKLC